MREIELKLELTEDGARALEQSPLLPAASATVTDLHSTYFDTPDHALHRNGLALRIRRTGGQHVQTVKADGPRSVGLFTRSEWNLPLGGGTTPLADHDTPVPALLEADFGRLAPVCEIPVQRTRWHIPFHGALIEVALDRGEIRAAGRQEAFREIELERLDGPASALFALARQIDAIAPVRLGVLSKAERGYRLLEALPLSCKAEDLHLHPGMDLPEILAAIVQSCLRQYRLNETILLSATEAEAVHQARVGLRRLRAGLAVFRDFAGGTPLQAIDRRLRTLALVLGTARDFDVLLPQVADAATHSKVAAAREAAYRDVARVLAAAETRMLPLDLAEWLACGDWRSDPARTSLREMPPRDFAVQTLESLFRKLRKHGRHLASLDPDKRHRLRKNAKKLRYTAEFFAGLFPSKEAQQSHRKFIKRLQALQDDLGALNDATTAAGLLLALDGAGSTGGPELPVSAKEEAALLESAEDHFLKLTEHEPFWR